MATIHVKDREGAMYEISGKDGQSVMEAIRDAGLPIEAQCGGCASCATCHIYVADECKRSLALTFCSIV